MSLARGDGAAERGVARVSQHGSASQGRTRRAAHRLWINSAQLLAKLLYGCRNTWRFYSGWQRLIGTTGGPNSLALRTGCSQSV